MAVVIRRDADNKWFFGIDWSDFFAEIVDKYGGTVTLTASSWNIPATWVQEAETAFNATSNIATLVCSGGTNGDKEDVTNTITYSVSALTLTDATQDRTRTIILEDQ